MLSATISIIEQEKPLVPSEFHDEMSSRLGWVEGRLTAFKVKSTLQKSTGEHETLATDAFFQIEARPQLDLALITTPEYFSSGLDTLPSGWKTDAKRDARIGMGESAECPRDSSI